MFHCFVKDGGQNIDTILSNGNVEIFTDNIDTLHNLQRGSQLE